MMNKAKCDNCGEQEAQIRQISRSYGSGQDLLVIEGIPLISCSNRGESYFTAETLHEVERIKLHRKRIRRDKAGVRGKVPSGSLARRSRRRARARASALRYASGDQDRVEMSW